MNRPVLFRERKSVERLLCGRPRRGGISPKVMLDRQKTARKNKAECKCFEFLLRRDRITSHSRQRPSVFGGFFYTEIQVFDEQCICERSVFGEADDSLHDLSKPYRIDAVG